jgi:predicted PurR-regulated permease PerM
VISRFSLTAQQKRLLLWLALGLLVIWLIWAAMDVLIPYFVGAVVAYLLLPLVNWLHRHMPSRLQAWGVARAIAIVITYLLVIALIAGIFAFLVPIIIEQINVLEESWPDLVSTVRDWGERGLGWYQEIEIPLEWRTTIETNLRDLLDDVVAAVQEGVVVTVRTVSGTVGFIIGLIVIPFWLFYILHDESQVTAGVLRALPEQARADVIAISRLVDDVLSAYIRGQLLLVLFVGLLALISLFIIGVPFALVLAIIAGLFEVLPFVGPILGAIPAVLVALLSDPGSAIWVALAFFGIQQIENLVLAPRIAGESVKLHPAAVMVVIVVGNAVAGFLGLLLAVPIAAIIRDLFKYGYLRLLDEPLTPEQAVAQVRSGQEVRLSV